MFLLPQFGILPLPVVVVAHPLAALLILLLAGVALLVWENFEATQPW